MKKCKYCNRQIDDGCIRCYKCDIVWRDGLKAGQEDIKNKLHETLYTLFKLSGFNKQ